MLPWKRKRKQLLLKMMVGWRLENGIELLLHERLAVFRLVFGDY
jgi:hypothetical protein